MWDMWDMWEMWDMMWYDEIWWDIMRYGFVSGRLSAGRECPLMRRRSRCWPPCRVRPNENMFQAFQTSEDQALQSQILRIIWGVALGFPSFGAKRMSASLEKASFFTLKELETLGKSKGVIPQALIGSAHIHTMARYDKIESDNSAMDLCPQQSNAMQMALSQSDYLKWISNFRCSKVVVSTLKDWTYEAVKDVVESLVADDEVQSDKATWFFLHLFYVFKSQSALGCSVQKSMKCTSLPERTLAALSISWYHSNAWMLVQVGSQLLFWALPSQRTATLQNKRQKLEALSGRNEGT